MAAAGDRWSTVLSPLGYDGEYDASFCNLKEALRQRSKRRATVMVATDGPWLLGCDLPKQCFRHGILRDSWASYLSDWWNIRWDMCRAHGLGDAHRMRARDQLPGIPVSGDHFGTKRARRLALVVIVLAKGMSPRINDSIVPNATVLERREHITSPEWHPADEAWEVAYAFPSKFAD